MAIHKIKFFAGRGSRYLAEKIAAEYGTKLGDSDVVQFSDGEFQPCYNESIRGCTVFIIQSTFPPSDNLMELLMMADAARRASAYHVIAVIPYFGWARQDRKDRPRVPITARLVANMLVAAGVDRVMTMDLHADQIQGFFDLPVDALYASGIFIPYMKGLNIDDLSIAAPDMGGAKRASAYAKHLGTPIIISHKERAKANVVGSMTAIGEVEGRNVIIVDDRHDLHGRRHAYGARCQERARGNYPPRIVGQGIRPHQCQRFGGGHNNRYHSAQTDRGSAQIYRSERRAHIRRRHRTRTQLQADKLDIL